jgi:acyl carrier protein
MSTVNFKVFLEETFSVMVPENLLEGGSSVGEIIAFIRKPN